jgi:hypothetical protein
MNYNPIFKLTGYICEEAQLTTAEILFESKKSLSYGNFKYFQKSIILTGNCFNFLLTANSDLL